MVQPLVDAEEYEHDRCFYSDGPGLGPISDRVSELQNASRLVIRGAEGEHDWTIFVVAGRAAAVVADGRIRICWVAETRRATGGLEALPDFIALPRDEQGRPIIPRTRVTALVEAQQAWESELGTLDAVTATIIAGKLVMPKVALPSQQTFLLNLASWEKDPKAKEALCPVIAKWLQCKLGQLSVSLAAATLQVELQKKQWILVLKGHENPALRHKRHFNP